MYYTSVINIHTTPSNDLVLFWLLCVSVALMISPEVFTIYVATIAIKMVPLITTDASIDPISFIICLITSISAILIISSMITFISTILIISLMIICPYLPYWLQVWPYPFPPYWLSASQMIIYVSTTLTISTIISISTILTISIMIIFTISHQIGVIWFSKHRRIFVLVK